MFKDFLKTLVRVGAAFLLACMCRIGLGEAYFGVSMCCIGVNLLYIILCITLGGAVLGENEIANAANLVIVLIAGAGIVGCLIVSWVISRMFSCNIFTVYMVINIIFRLIPSNTKE